MPLWMRSQKSRLIIPAQGGSPDCFATFAGDLEWDSLVVMDFVANVEDEFDILISMNRAAEIETVDQLVEAVKQLESEK